MLAAIAHASTENSPPAGPDAPNQFAWKLLVLHNAERERVGVSDLTWSSHLAKDAKEWADRLADEGRMRHASRQERKGAGENLWMGSAGYFGPDVMIGAFADERRHYLHGSFPEVSSTGQWQDVGHYTQMVWRETKQVGCAIARGERDDFLVCRYWPAGNFIGRKAF